MQLPAYTRIGADVASAAARRLQSGAAGAAASVSLARGMDWRVDDVICTSGPADRPFEECHADVSIALVVAGSFEYRTNGHREAMAPGSVMLGNDGQSFECGHRHGVGDRCVSFHFTPEFFARLAHDAGGRGANAPFSDARIPPIRALSRVNADAAIGIIADGRIDWNELAVDVAATVARVASSSPSRGGSLPRGVESRVMAIVRAIEHDPSAPASLDHLAALAGMSVFTFLRAFRRVAGVTPHQFILRSRLRQAALRLSTERTSVIDVALASGFGDLSNFNHSFRAEYGTTPRQYSAASRRGVVLRAGASRDRGPRTPESGR